tara:strand:+ start:3405 stop:5792 length:2388 start_codon:yes stop_codon:yes gene_type:complete
MSYLSKEKVKELKDILINDLSHLGKLYKARKKENDYISITHNMVIEKEKEGWVVEQRLSTKTKLYRPKSHSRLFEDQIWCLFYDFGFRILNFDENFELKYGPNEIDTQQIDVVAINDDIAIVIECKSSQKLKSIDHKKEMESLGRKKDGYKKCIEQIVGPRRIKYIFATRNQILGEISKLRLESEKVFHLDDNALIYLTNLNKTYRTSSIYQLNAILFKHEVISSDKIKIPCIKGSMGKKDYYMFSITPELLLNIGFVLHRTRTNEREDPTYQRLLVPSRLKSLNNFIDNGGFFPNSILLNFISGKKKYERLIFEEGPGKDNISSKSEIGYLIVPHMYAIAYIIDGQHRVYGYAATDHKEKATIPVVAFKDLTSEEQLEMFLSINENQKKISPRLRLTLQEDINWNSTIASSRFKALRSAIINRLGDMLGPLKDVLSIGEDELEMSPRFIDLALSKAPGILPKSRGNKIIDNNFSFYNTGNLDHSTEMESTKKHVSELINETFKYVMEYYPSLWVKQKRDYFIRSNRGCFALIHTIGSLNKFLCENKEIETKSNVSDRFESIKKYLDCLLTELNSGISTFKDPKNVLGVQGAQAEKFWTMYFQSIINQKFPNFITNELIEYRETLDEKIQADSKRYLDDLEKLIKNKTLQQMKNLFTEDAWELEVPQIRKQCLSRVVDYEQNNKDEPTLRTSVEWTDMLMLLDYYKIAEKNWSKENKMDAATFQSIFSVNIDVDDINKIKKFELGKISKKADGLNWLKKINSYRNTISHLASRGTGLTQKELQFIKVIYETINTQ